MHNDQLVRVLGNEIRSQSNLLFSGTWMYRLLKISSLPTVVWVRNLKRGSLLRLLGVGEMVTLTVVVAASVC